MTERRRSSPDLTVIAVPFYFASMAAEYWWLRRRAAARGPSAGDYERRDTVASLAMGVGSLLAPLVVPRLLRPLTPGRGRFGKAVVVAALGAVAVTTVADAVARREDADQAVAAADRRRWRTGSGRRHAAPGGWLRWAAWPRWWPGGCRHHHVGVSDHPRTALEAPAAPRIGAPARWLVAAAIAGWDFIYYWNHRFMHESRYMWALHVVHHSSERYNLSTALRQPVADALGTTLPYGAAVPGRDRAGAGGHRPAG